MDTQVYSIRNVVTGKMYIGSTSRRLDVRVHEHFKALRNGKHYSIPMQKDFDQYGWNAFEVKALTPYVPDGTKRELELIKFFDSDNPRFGYNKPIKSRRNRHASNQIRH